MPADNPNQPIADPAPDPAREPRRRWWLSVRGLMLLVLLLGGPIGWEANRASRMRRAIAVLQRNPGDPPGNLLALAARIMTIGGSPTRAEVQYDDERWDGVYLDPPLPVLDRLRRMVGADHFRRVSGLKLSRRPTPADWEAIRSFGALQELDLGSIDLGDDDLAGLAGCPNLRELSLFDTKATDRTLARVGALGNLRVLDLRMTSVTAAGLAHLAGLARLEELRLGEAAGTDAGLAHLAGLTNLRVLGATGFAAAVSDAGLAHLRELTGLEELRLTVRGMSDAGVAVLVGLPRLRDLEIAASSQQLQEGFALTPAGVEQLGRFPRLEVLKLQAMPAADDAWVRAIARVGTLRDLDIAGQRITDAGLAPLGRLPRLEELRIASPEVTDAGLAHLQPLADLIRVSFFARVTPEGAEGFRAAHKKLKSIRVDLWPKGEERRSASGLLEVPEPPLPLPPPPSFGPGAPGPKR